MESSMNIQYVLHIVLYPFYFPYLQFGSSMFTLCTGTAKLYEYSTHCRHCSILIVLNFFSHQKPYIHLMYWKALWLFNMFYTLLYIHFIFCIFILGALCSLYALVLESSINFQHIVDIVLYSLYSLYLHFESPIFI